MLFTLIIEGTNKKGESKVLIRKVYTKNQIQACAFPPLLLKRIVIGRPTNPIMNYIRTEAASKDDTTLTWLLDLISDLISVLPASLDGSFPIA